MTPRRDLEWFVWNAAALSFWLALVLQRPIIWPMLLLILPLQVVANIVLNICKKRSLLMFWTLLCVIAAGLGWLIAVHYRCWFPDVLAIIPLGRALYGTWSARSSFLSEV